ncbi:MAG: sodium:solute symporter [Gammaproteobacteria bacterium]|nr:sodium:solute symporter [Gammaproteobacteria bacterium]MDE2460971.1 sodium:solute symporter [Gammaproteobacteria bacterium]
MNWPALIVFVLLFVLVTVLGFVAARWRRGNLNHLNEWGLAGRRFGTVVTWFLLGGDLYTAYTFVAVPALVFGAGAIGFFALPYTLMVYPFVYVVFPRLWSVSRKHGYVTASDFVRGRYDSGLLALVVAITGILATMPYIALQLVGIQVVIAAMGFTGSGLVGDLPLIIAFAILAAFTYTSGLRAPALIAVVKDLLIYIVIIAAVIVIPMQLGGYGHIFAAIPEAKLLLKPPSHGNLGSYSAYATLALGSALALFLYPHCVTGVLSANSRRTIKRNMSLLPAYSLVLALIAFLGYMAVAAGVQHDPAYAGWFKQYGTTFAVPALLLHSFPAWFAGVGFAAIAIGALVPAAIMSIAASNLFTRNIYKEYLKRDASPEQEAKTSKVVSLIVKLGALAFIIFLPEQYAIQLQLLGGVWIIQTLPAVVIGLYTRWLHRWALVIGWAAGMAVGTGMVAAQDFKTSIYPLHLGALTVPGYAALYSVIVNIVVAIVFTAIFSALKARAGSDETSPDDYESEAA